MKRLAVRCYPPDDVNWLVKLLHFLEHCDVGDAWVEFWMQL